MAKQQQDWLRLPAGLPLVGHHAQLQLLAGGQYQRWRRHQHWRLLGRRRMQRVPGRATVLHDGRRRRSVHHVSGGHVARVSGRAVRERLVVPRLRAGQLLSGRQHRVATVRRGPLLRDAGDASRVSRGQLLRRIGHRTGAVRSGQRGGGWRHELHRVCAAQHYLGGGGGRISCRQRPRFVRARLGSVVIGVLVDLCICGRRCGRAVHRCFPRLVHVPVLPALRKMPPIWPNSVLPRCARQGFG